MLTCSNKTVINFESASAALVVDPESKTVFIENLEAGERGRGHASRLLNLIKSEYPDFIISGNMQPTDYSRPQKPSAGEMGKAYDLGCDFAQRKLVDPGFPLTQEEKLFREKILKQYLAWAGNDPAIKLFLFYKKNYFTFPAGFGGPFVSQPPHTLRASSG